MFQVGDVIVNSNNGVCRIEAVGKLNFSGMDKTRDYYTLRPLFDAGSTIFIPVDSDKVFMRAAMTKEDALNLIEQIKDIEPIWIQDEKSRESKYKEVLRSCDCNQLIQIIKTIFHRKKKRMDDGKKVTAVDERYFNLAENKLYGEIALALNMTKDEVKNYIKERMNA